MLPPGKRRYNAFLDTGITAAAAGLVLATKLCRIGHP
jgi:hypothetical protein